MPETAVEAPKLRVLLIGAGGRDHALAWSFSTSPLLKDLHVAPGNPGIATVATCYPDLAVDDMDGFVRVADELRPDLVVIGAEDLLVTGLADRMREIGLTVLGPSAAAAQLEGSKTFSKSLMDHLGIPTAAWRRFDDRAEALAFACLHEGQVAIKADGLAAGCGAIVCHSKADANRALETLFTSDESVVIIEELLEGHEASVMAVCDGKRIRVLPVARDYKRLGDLDTGPNTGGMGSHAPSSDLSSAEADALAERTIQPIVEAMSTRGIEFRGIIYAGIMLTDDGPYVLEYNCRFGNPETQSLVRIIEEDLLAVLIEAANGSLSTTEPIEARGAAVSVCVATSSYPVLQLEPTPIPIRGFNPASCIPGVETFVGFSAMAGDADFPAVGASIPNQLLALGGRSVTVSAWAPTFAEAVECAYMAVECIELDSSHFRRDVGAPALDGLLVIG